MMAYTAAAQLTGNARFKEVVDDIYTYIARDLTHPSGGFYSAEDADSLPSQELGHKLEGAFCVWSWAEVEQLLGGEEVEGHTLAQLVQHEFHMAANGNVSPQGDPHGELLQGVAACRLSLCLSRASVRAGLTVCRVRRDG